MKTVAVGQKVSRRDHSPNDMETVSPACEVKDRGNWYCATCGRIVGTMDDPAEDHDKKNHILAWACFEHGLEVP